MAPFFPLAPSVVADVSLAGNHSTAVGAWHSLLDSGVGNEGEPSGRFEDGEH